MENAGSGRPALQRVVASRRMLLRGAVGLSLAGLLAACGSDGDDDDGEGSSSPTPTQAPTANDPTPTPEPEPEDEPTEEPDPTATTESDSGETGAAYPVTIEHTYGSTTIEEYPERIVLVGLVEQDALLAMGVVPVATSRWFGEHPGAIFPWAEDLLGDAEVPVVLDSIEIPFEQIAALEPDVIVGLYAGLTEDEFNTLNQIAPTVAQPAEYVSWGIPWQELTLAVGDIIGKRQEAEELVAETEALFESVREDHPEFIGAQAAVASPFGLPENYYVYSSQDARGRLISSLGFEVPEVFDEMAGEEFGATVSVEQFDLIADLDALIWVSEAEALEDVELYQALPVVQEGRVLYYGSGIYDALNFATVLSLPYAIEQLVPDLVAVIDGNPETEPAG